MSEDPEDQHITRRDLSTELKSLRWEVRALIAGMVVVTNFNVPKEITAAALALAFGAAAVNGLAALVSH